ncbi:hypothetical protein PV-S19_0428 [Pacmanvirus S19]|nr:hypothetical protein PV-S19_0428 [Pacmanvirus S19]
MDIKKIKYGQLVGIGEASHGTSEYQIQRLKIIKYLRQQGPIQVFIEASYPVIESLKVPNLTQHEFKNLLVESKIFGFYKSKEFLELLWYLYYNKIPFYGVDIQIRGQERLIKNPITDYISKFYKKSYTDNNFRDEKIQELIDILWDKSTRGIFLAHNYHISRYVRFT